VDGVSVEGVYHIRNIVSSHFKAYFQTHMVDRSGVDNLQFWTFSDAEGGGLINPFSKEKVKAVVWDCYRFKSSGPDGINFGFIEEFWQDMKDDIMRFISEFHRNGKLTKGINNTFIALIPKVDSPLKLNDFGQYLWWGIFTNIGKTVSK
jgi:hypothetical protein